MKTIYLGFFLTFVYLIPPISGITQTPEDNLLKYWYYRERMKHFVVSGTNMGESNMAGIRNRISFPEWPILNCNMDFAQNGVYFGYYLGILATEYRILKDNGYPEYAQLTENELVLALSQYYNEMELSEHHWNSSYQDIFDGFFTRNCVPLEFLDPNHPFGRTLTNPSISHEELLNEDLTRNDMYDPATYQFGDLPQGHPGWVTYGGDEYPIPNKNMFTFLNIYDLGGMSEDELIGVIMGFALIYQCMGDASSIIPETGLSVINTAKSFALIILEKIKYDLKWELHDPHGDWYDNCGDYAFGYAMVGEFFGENREHYYVNWASMAASQQWWMYMMTLSPGTLKNDLMAGTLAAIGDSWIWAGQNWTYVGINNKFDEYEIHTFYLMLYKVLNPEIELGSDVEVFAREQLNFAPGEGPYHYGGDNHPPEGWAYSYKWRGTVSEQNYGTDDFKGNYSGCDYMLAYNLYILAHSIFEPSYYPHKNHSCFEIWPVTLENNIIKGYEINPVQLAIFKTLETNSKILSSLEYTYNSSTNTYIPSTPNPNYQGFATYIASKEIKLQPGFSVEKSANFTATIDPHIFWPVFNGNNSFVEGSIGTLPYSLKDKQGIGSCNSVVVNKSMRSNLKPFNSETESNDVKSIGLSNEYCFSVFPNPTSDKLQIKIPNVSSLIKITIHDNHSQVLKSMTTKDSEFVIDLSNYRSGIYLLQIITDQTIFTSRVIKID